MATINTPNDPNKNVSTANAAPQQVNPAANSGVQTQSGQFSTLQKYLGANKNAGQRIAGMVGGNLNNETNQLKGTTQRELGESNQANQNFGNLTNQTQGFTQRLYQPAVSLNTVNGKAYDVNSYGSNMAGQDAVKDIASDQNQLQTFTGIRTGDAAAKQKAESDKQASEAMQAAGRAYDANKQRQSQLTSNPGRDQLISQSLNTKNQRAGLRNLDNAFLTQDKSGALNNLSNNLRSDVGALQQNINQGDQQTNAVAGLNQNQLTAQTGLNDRLTGMETEYDSLLNSRMGEVNNAKDARMQELQTEYGRLQRGEAVRQGFADMLGLDKVSSSAALNPDTVTTQAQTPYKDVRLFNTLKDQSLKDVLNTQLLEQKAMSGADVANSKDVENLSRLATLMGKRSAIGDASKFAGNQVAELEGEKNLSNRLNDRASKFLTDDLTKTFNGSGYKQEDIRGSSAMARAYSNAGASLNDVLQGNIYRNTSGSQSRGWEDSVGNGLGAILTGGANLLVNDNARGNVQEDVNNTLEGVIRGGTNILPGLAVGVNPQISNAVGGYLRGLQGNMRGAGMHTDGGLEGRYIGNGEWGRSMNSAESQSVGQVRDQANQYINDIGYKNLLKITQGDF